MFLPLGGLLPVELIPSEQTQELPQRYLKLKIM